MDYTQEKWYIIIIIIIILVAGVHWFVLHCYKMLI